MIPGQTGKQRHCFAKCSYRDDLIAYAPLQQFAWMQLDKRFSANDSYLIGGNCSYDL